MCRYAVCRRKLAYYFYRSYIADYQHKFFYNCEVALHPLICFPIRLAFHQHLIHTEPILAAQPNIQTTHEGNFWLAIIPSFQITLIKVWPEGCQKEDSQTVSHWHCTYFNRIALASLSSSTSSSAAMGGYSLPAKMQNMENTTFIARLGLSFAIE